MNIVELEQIVRGNITGGMEAVALYLTIVSGYLIATYTAGKDLPKFLCFLITSLFLVFSLLTMNGSYQFYEGAHSFSRIFGPELQYPIVPLWYAWAIVIIELAGTIGCLVYMHQVRKK